MEPDVAQLLTVAGLAPIVALVSQLVWRTLGHNASGDQLQDRFGPIVAVGIGVMLAVIGLTVTSIAGVTRLDFAEAALTGLVGGLTAIGLHDVWTTRAGTG